MKLSTLYTSSNLPYVRLSDTKTSGTAGTSYTNGAYRTVTINTENSDSQNICSLSSNRFTLSEGTYVISIAYQTPRNGSAYLTPRLRNITDSTTVYKWPATRVLNAAGGEIGGDYISFLDGRLTIGASKELELQVDVTATVSQVANSDGENEVYWVIELVKID